MGNIHKTFTTELNQKWVLVTGDARVFDLLQQIRTDYGENLKWLIPLPGDQHTLYNFQKVIMKPYADASLVNLVKVARHRSETLTSLRTGE